MFKKFTVADNVSTHSQVKSSVMRKIQKSLLEQYPTLENQFELIFPKKTPVFIAKCDNHAECLIVEGQPWFFQVRGGDWVPTLRTLHKYPLILPRMRVDCGAIPFVMKGSNIMCPGFTSAGGSVDVDGPVEADTIVAIMAEGKTHALAVGLTKMSSEEITKKNKGICVDSLNYLGDGMWLTKTF